MKHEPWQSLTQERDMKYRTRAQDLEMKLLQLESSLTERDLELFEEKITFPKVKSIDDLKKNMDNEFEKSLFYKYPVLAEMKSILLKNGAFGALVSGSGSAVFGAFRQKNLQNQAYKSIACLQIGEIFSCETLENHCYF